MIAFRVLKVYNTVASRLQVTNVSTTTVWCSAEVFFCVGLKQDCKKC